MSQYLPLSNLPYTEKMALLFLTRSAEALECGRNCCCFYFTEMELKSVVVLGTFLFQSGFKPEPKPIQLLSSQNRFNGKLYIYPAAEVHPTIAWWLRQVHKRVSFEPGYSDPFPGLSIKLSLAIPITLFFLLTKPMRSTANFRYPTKSPCTLAMTTFRFA